MLLCTKLDCINVIFCVCPPELTFYFALADNNIFCIIKPIKVTQIEMRITRGLGCTYQCFRRVSGMLDMLLGIL